MKSKTVHLIILFSIATLSIACARLYSLSTGHFTLTSTQQVLNLLEKRKENFKDLRGLVSISLQSEDETYAFQEALLLQVPARIRMEVLSPFGNPVLIMVASETNLAIFDITRKKFYQGDPTQENLYRFLQLPMRSEDLVYLLSGNMPQLDLDPPAKLMIISDQKFYQIEGTNAHYSGKWKIWIDSQDLVPVRAALFSMDGILIYDIYYENFLLNNNYLLPHELTILVPSEAKRLSFRYKSIALNRGIPQDAFQLKVPNGIEVIRMN